MEMSCLLIGGDIRHRYLAELLIEQGFTVYCYGMDNCNNLHKDVIATASVPVTGLVILPIPVTKDGKNIYATFSKVDIDLYDTLRKLHPSTKVFGGMIPQPAKEQLEEKAIQVYDYGASQSFARANALPSAEGAIQVAMEHTPDVLEGKRVCVVGYGKIGKVLSGKLQALGCRVTATARKERDLEQIMQQGITAVPTGQLDGQPPFELIFNTVPAPVVTSGVIDRQTNRTLMIDLASKPGGVDFAYANQRGIPTIHALSLPALYAPYTAAEIVWQEILDFLKERG